jgi:two-component system sensor histidine kinase PilS (NtrC family)
VADPDGVSQIFWNLARNALKAMPEGGELTVSGRVRGGVYELEVADTGRGMDEEERANLFHPFQSFFDSGTGLGMAIVYRIVQDLGGRLAVESRPRRYTRITVGLPVATGVALEGPAPTLARAREA